ncbi:hypothetical protein TOPH_08127 [Tolypocladium ophioglossoides CBS 100239]|uniref:Uncharacterized protein n=1 Tax=Tolypocladium ophioglossoides (strain CBS 100239) TaxID=1163406 RepID=A0A0L0N0B4_TOLOC|nr:hypothetical protein TOPH_08127 [Tolypocladium ophioglossoides CBS 100239]
MLQPEHIRLKWPDACTGQKWRSGSCPVRRSSTIRRSFLNSFQVGLLLFCTSATIENFQIQYNNLYKLRRPSSKTQQQNVSLQLCHLRLQRLQKLLLRQLRPLNRDAAAFSDADSIYGNQVLKAAVQ